MEKFNKFIETYAPSQDLQKPTREMLDLYTDKLPKELLDFWQEYGFGNYGDGIIKVVDPSEYAESLYTWLGGKKPNYHPIMVTGFGDLFYYRKLTPTDDDVCLVNIHYRKTQVCTYSFNDFFEDYLTDPKMMDKILRRPLFEEATQKLGKLSADEIFYFAPSISMGGGEAVKYVDKGIGSVVQMMLIQMG